ncbi:hypothetical protein LG634_06890 [Streptomyces bambusae]|uniref:hypothetical protein n=1 Tax=Streptomyces bambusae TaxID=1550616 RepID=UPI001CFC5442|nr:hypothetical protein [Streptomyces bambusae]MCB5164559.1 hypothetical protein [Streptomyces bambusae]
MPGPELPRRPKARQREDWSKPLPGDAFAVKADVPSAYGRRSPALSERARRGWQKLGDFHIRIRESREEVPT